MGRDRSESRHVGRVGRSVVQQDRWDSWPENESGSHHVLSGIGTHYIVLPFMERNGFLDGSGWWIPDQGKELQV